MALNIHTLMKSLAERRPVFHNEADFQFALASFVREECGQPVRLEWKPFPTEPTAAPKNEYTRLGGHLASRSAKPWAATFAELEGILRAPLPDKAKEDRMWWANCYDEPQARVWLATGWRVTRVDIEAKTVVFGRARMYVDLWLPALNVAIELKYRTRELVCVAPSSDLDPPQECFSLANQFAQDHGRYDFLKDVERLESVLGRRPDVRRGIAIMVTNNPLYWEVSKKDDARDAAFHFHHGSELCRRPDGMDWAEGTKQGTKQGRDVPVVLNGSYRMEWKCYSIVNGDREARNRTFRYLAVEVSRSSAGAAAGESPKNQPGPAPSP